MNALLARAAAFPDTGLRFLDRRERACWLSWAEIGRSARLVAGGLRTSGIAPGERVALIYPTCPEFFSAFFGILLCGAVPVPLYPPVRLGRLDEYHRRTAAMLSAVEARLILTESRLRRLLGETVRATGLAGRTLDDLPSGEALDLRVEPSDLALVQFSSGTTVAPKPVALTHRAILAQVRTLNGFWPEARSSGSEERDRERGGGESGVSWLPLYHDMGLIGCVFPALERPGVLTLIGPEVFVARPATWLRAISRYRATISVAPNFAYGLCVEKIRDDELEGVDLSGWRVALNGAEPVAPSVLRAFERRFASWGFSRTAMTPVYGLSEAALAVTFSRLEQPFRTARFDAALLATSGEAVASDNGVEKVSVGRPLPGFEIRIVDPEGRDLPPARVGRVLTRGPSLMEGYLGRPEATAAVFDGEWLDTGDLGFLFDGELFLTSRAKDVVILRGRNHAPADLEQQLDGVAGMRTGCAVAVGHLAEDGSGEELILFVEHARGAAPDLVASLAGRCSERVLAGSGLKPSAVVVLAPGTLPRTSSGKLRRQETLRRHLAGELDTPARVTPFYLTKTLARSALAHAAARRERRDGG